MLQAYVPMLRMCAHLEHVVAMSTWLSAACYAPLFPQKKRAKARNAQRKVMSMDDYMFAEKMARQSQQDLTKDASHQKSANQLKMEAQIRAHAEARAKAKAAKDSNAAALAKLDENRKDSKQSNATESKALERKSAESKLADGSGGGDGEVPVAGPPATGPPAKKRRRRRKKKQEGGTAGEDAEVLL